MNIFLHELKSYRKSIITWTTSIALISLFFISMFPTYKSQSAALKEMIKGMPPQLLSGFGIDINTFFTILGFYSFIFLYISLCGAIQAMNLGLSVMSKEIRDKTADFLLTKPVSRIKIMTCKLLAIFTSIIITNCIFLAVSGITIALVSDEPVNYKTFFLLSITLLFIQIIFISMGLIISVTASKIKSVTPISLGIVFGTLAIYMMANSLKDYKARYFTPFGYFVPTKIIQNTSYEPSFCIIALIFVAAAIISSYVIYIKKDIHAV